MADALTAVYSIAVLLAAVVGVAGVVYATRETGEADLTRIGLAGAGVLLFVVALVVTMLQLGA
ncbi:hypothetical protein [Halorarum salinum]|uniref:Uncharacterized protein n=1 Tax=Halorarum salinum TaxID=2743089 RepID=A0A7D5L9W1_9EURY|nr:hypothetical protein [Halobaculum salinum]QLG61391.1 hypothetical protein HUG12_06435 [Halobaculum salinum]